MTRKRRSCLLLFFISMLLFMATGSEGTAKAADKQKESQEDAGSFITVSRTADIVFIVDTTGSMGTHIANVKKNILNFVDKISTENVDVRVKIIGFAGAGALDSSGNLVNWARTNGSGVYVSDTQEPVSLPSRTGWYTKADINTVKTELEKFPFTGSNGGEECPLVPIVDILSKEGTYFRNGSKDTTAKFIVLITDETYKPERWGNADKGTYYKSQYSGQEYGVQGYVDTLAEHPEAAAGTKGVVEELERQKINVSVVTRNSLFSDFSKFVTKPTTLASGDGGMMADITGDFDILFEKLAERVVEVTEIKQNEIISRQGGYKPVKVCANMIALKKQDGCTYKMTPTGPAVTTPVWSAEQTSCVFKSLSPSSIYTFQVISSGAIIDEYELETESTTGARFKDIPKVVYEGEVYNIKPDADITHMMATSGSSIEWICNTDCVSIKPDKVGNGCQMSVNDCEYNSNKRLKVVLEANVTYGVKGKNGEYTTKTKKLKKKFEVENTVDALDIGSFLGSSENVYKDGVISLGTTESVQLDMILNQGEETDTATRQRMAYYISDCWGVKNPKGQKIAKVNSRGKIVGVNAGVTYVTIAPKHTYNPYGKCYDFMATIPIICQPVTEVTFDAIKMKAEDPNILNYIDDTATDEENYVVSARVGDSFDLREYLKYNPANAFNQEEMKQSWVSSERAVATVNSKGIVKCKGPGYVTITVTPTGGLEISAATGRRDVNAKPCSASVVIKVAEKE